MPIQQSACGSCGAPIFWLKNIKTGKIAPIDAVPSEQGNIAVDAFEGMYDVVGRDAAAANRRDGLPLYTNHFMTCPQAKTWHKHGARGAK